VEGAEGLLLDAVYAAIRTRPGFTTTRSQLQRDIDAVFATGWFQNVQATPEDTPLGYGFALWCSLTQCSSG
jgi:outer membrane protein insertion porin family